MRLDCEELGLVQTKSSKVISVRYTILLPCSPLPQEPSCNPQRSILLPANMTQTVGSTAFEETTMQMTCRHTAYCCLRLQNLNAHLVS